MFGTMLIGLGLATLGARQVQRHGWMSATPTAAYILLLTYLDQATTLDELDHRVVRGELRHWEYRMLVHRLINVLRDQENELAVLIRAARLLANIENGRNRKEQVPWASWASASEFDLDGCLDALVGLLDHDDVEVRVQGLRTLGQFIHRAEPALPALLGQLASDEEPIQRAAHHAVSLLSHSARHGIHAPTHFLHFMHPARPDISREGLAEYGLCGLDADCARAVAERELLNPNPFNRALAIYVLAILHGHDPEVHRTILDHADDSNHSVRWVVLNTTTIMPLNERVEQTLRSALRDRERSTAALQAIWRRGSDGALLLDDVHACLQAARQFNVDVAARCFVSIGGDPHIAIQAVLNTIDMKSSSFGESTMIDTLGSFKTDSPDACEVLRAMFDNHDVDIASAAAVAYVRLGGTDLDAATKVVFQSAVAAAAQPGSSIVFGRWFWLAAEGRFSHDVLRSMLQDKDAAVRARAARFLGEAGAASAPLLPELRRLLDDPDPQVQRWAPDAVKRVEFLSR